MMSDLKIRLINSFSNTNPARMEVDAAMLLRSRRLGMASICWARVSSRRGRSRVCPKMAKGSSPGVLKVAIGHSQRRITWNLWRVFLD